ncbi:hypothetical protein ACFSKU_11855 [Pontibacter silvestris]|uniref:NigD-like protein n=1 Tax=Pontibacter silvestris TaxID=2305183 RepID=A0ABW4X007_9BACT|nr:hypothetical protein [Pontibacter silvestris]MCC9135287.1 hypothetical protein [Pontibacter silvestris]
MKKALLLLAFVAAVFEGCTESSIEPDPQFFGYEYYPIAVGDYKIYEVTDTKYQNNVGVTEHFQLRERVDTSFLDQTNTLSYKIIRSIRQDANSNWLDDSVMVVTKSDNSLILMKDNRKRIKLIFPVENGKQWNADAFNANEAESKDEFYYSDVAQPFTVNDQPYDTTVTVVQGIPANNIVKLDDKKEVYAKNIGMVYRLFKRLSYCNQTESSECDLGSGYIIDGHERQEVLISYGNLR